eukprot:scaffold680_cov176-Ochromonas_danica.AAC.1
MRVMSTMMVTISSPISSWCVKWQTILSKEIRMKLEETLRFAWKCTTGGKNSYARAKDEESAAILDDVEKHAYTMVENMMVALGLKGCKDTVVGNGKIRGVSGGQKRRVTIGELFVCPRHPPPDVYRLFDELILMDEGHVIYHGPREQVLPYFESLGYKCPPQVDDADFLQELPSIQGRRYLVNPSTAPQGAKELAAAWKKSSLYSQLCAEMRYPSLEDGRQLCPANDKVCLKRQFLIILRDPTFTKARMGQTLIVGAISGSLFSDIEKTDVNTMNGCLFGSVLFVALGSFFILPVIFDQKAVYYKQKESLFFPASVYALAQTITLIPLQIVENILFVTIVYWSAGLSSDYNGSRFLTFILISLALSMVINQLFRLTACAVESTGQALPLAGTIIVVMVLFSGYIQPKPMISDGWIWFYWLNPVGWALKAVSLNEYLSPKYDFLTCTNPTCTSTRRFGDYVLKQYGNPTR